MKKEKKHRKLQNVRLHAQADDVRRQQTTFAETTLREPWSSENLYKVLLRYVEFLREAPVTSVKKKQEKKLLCQNMSM